MRNALSGETGLSAAVPETDLSVAVPERRGGAGAFCLCCGALQAGGARTVHQRHLQRLLRVVLLEERRHLLEQVLGGVVLVLREVGVGPLALATRAARHAHHGHVDGRGQSRELGQQLLAPPRQLLQNLQRGTRRDESARGGRREEGQEIRDGR